MPSQRIILGIGLAILLIIGAASIGLDFKSRSDNATVDRALGILPKLSDLRPQLRRAESAARAEVEATVDVLVDIDARGEVGRVEIARWAGYGLDQSVIDTVKQMHFFPAMRDRVSIPMRVLLRYNFRKPPK